MHIKTRKLSFQYIREMIANFKYPSFVAVLRETLKGMNILDRKCSILRFNTEIEISILEQYFTVEQEPEYVTRDSLRSRSFANSVSGHPKKKPTPIPAEDIDKKFVIKVYNASRVNCEDEAKIGIEVGLYHGGEPLCDQKTSMDVSVNNEGEAIWEENVPFDIDVADIPRMSRLCMVLYECSKSNKRTPLTWANITIFDFRGMLRTGCVCLSMWRYESPDIDRENLLHPLGTVVPNPNVDDETTLTIGFERYTDSESPIQYQIVSELESIIEGFNSEFESLKQTSNVPKNILEQFRQICDRDPLIQMTENDKRLLWDLSTRNQCYLALPQSLPHVLQSVKWNDRKSVKEMMRLLSNWPPIQPEVALGLLDYAYPDPNVRAYAIKCLEHMSDEDLMLLLLQLVQALKHESYLLNELARFLLLRALKNRHIGYQIFWLLRSEMQNSSVSVMYGLLLEAYCYGAKDHIKNLKEQISAMSKLCETSEYLKEEIARQKPSRDKQKALLLEHIKKDGFKDAFAGVVNPLDSRTRFGVIKADKCNLMDSKMKPIWLVFTNDLGAEDTYVIYKNGDGKFHTFKFQKTRTKKHFTVFEKIR